MIQKFSLIFFTTIELIFVWLVLIVSPYKYNIISITIRSVKICIKVKKKKKNWNDI